MTGKFWNKNVLFKVSIIANVIFILIFAVYGVALAVVNSADLRIAEFSALQAELCGDKYEEYLQRWEDGSGEEGKKAFAATVCLRDYKTGKDLNIEPLITP